MNSKSAACSSNPFSSDGGVSLGSKRPPPLLSSPTFTPKQMHNIQPPEAFRATPCALLRIASNENDRTVDEFYSDRSRPSLGNAATRPTPSPIGRSDVIRSPSPQQLISSTSSPYRDHFPDCVASDLSQLSLRKENDGKNATASSIAVGSNIGRLSLANSIANSNANPLMSSSHSMRRASVAIGQQGSNRVSLSGTAALPTGLSQVSSTGLMGPPPGKDPRPLREKNFQFSCIKSLIKFLSECGYDRPLSPKLLSSPSAKDFASIFKFLYAQLDPTFIWTSDKKFEEEVPVLLKSLR